MPKFISDTWYQLENALGHELAAACQQHGQTKQNRITDYRDGKIYTSGSLCTRCISDITSIENPKNYTEMILVWNHYQKDLISHAPRAESRQQQKLVLS